MAVINVATSDTFEQWRVKSNGLATLVGDDSGLTSRYTATDVIGALNEIKSNSTFDNEIKTSPCNSLKDKSRYSNVSKDVFAWRGFLRLEHYLINLKFL